jgi:hypothetical protein
MKLHLSIMFESKGLTVHNSMNIALPNQFIPKYYAAVRRQRILPGHVRDHTFPNQAR